MGNLRQLRQIKETKDKLKDLPEIGNEDEQTLLGEDKSHREKFDPQLYEDLEK